MTDYPYQPPERQFADTMLTFHDWSLVNSGVVARVEPDPLGDVNKSELYQAIKETLGLGGDK